jgi:hypothetical protein
MKEGGAMKQVLCLCLGMVMGFACSSAPKSALGESCTKTGDCVEGARCIHQVCVAGEGAKAKAPAKGPAAGGTHEVFRVATKDPEDPFLNVRAKATGKSELRAKLVEGTQVKVVGEKRKFRQVEVVSGEHAGTKGYVFFSALRPIGSVDIYRARLSYWDHFNHKCYEYDGDPDDVDGCVQLKSAAGIVRQDRANYHKFDVRDREDRDDMGFDVKSERAELAKLLKDQISKKDARIIRNRTPLVEVTVWPDRAEVKILDRGEELELAN